MWKDWKFQIRKKLTANKVGFNGTGGGRWKQHTFNVLEDKIIEILNLNEAINGHSSISFDDVITNNFTTSSPLENEVIFTENDEEDTSLTHLISRKRQRKTPTKNALLSEFVKNDENANINILTTLKDILVEQKQNTRYVRKHFEIKEKMLKLEQEKLDLAKEKFKQKQKYYMEKTKLKKDLLEYKSNVFNLQNN